MMSEVIEPTEKDETRCPFLGLVGDVNTFSDFPSEINFCHRCKPKMIPDFIHQRTICLTPRYSECVMVKEPSRKRLPPDLAITSGPENKRRVFLIASIIFLLLVISALFFFGIVQSDFGPTVKAIFGFPSQPSPTAVLPTNTLRPNTSTYTATLLPTNTPKPTRTPTPTRTERPTRTFTATIDPQQIPTNTYTPTPACVEAILYKSIAFFSGNQVQIAYDTSINLSPYRVLDNNGNPTQRLDLPGFRLLRENKPVYTYGTYQRDARNPGRLFLEMEAQKDDDIFLEFFDAGSRLCSSVFIIPDRMTTSTVAPTQTFTATSLPERTNTPTKKPTNTSVPPTKVPPTNTPIPPTPVPPTPTTPPPPTTEPPNIPPTIRITEPENNAQIVKGKPTTLSSDPSDVDGTIAKVEWYLDGTLLPKTGATITYQFPDKGPHTLTVIATDDDGATGEDSINIEIIDPINDP